MEIELLIYCITAIVSALGIKEIWVIWKKQIDIKNKSQQTNEKTKDQLTAQVIEELKHKIRCLELKIDDLLRMNKDCAVKLARLEERLNSSSIKKPKKSKPPKSKTLK